MLFLIIDVGMKVLKKKIQNPRCNIIRKWLSVGRSVAYYVNIISPHFFFKVRIGTVPTPAILPSHIGYAPLDLPYNCRVALCRERDKRRPPRWHAHFWNQCCEVDNLSCFRGIYLIFLKIDFFLSINVRLKLSRSTMTCLMMFSKLDFIKL